MKCSSAYGYDDIFIHGDEYGFTIKDDDLKESTNLSVCELVDIIRETNTLNQDRIGLCSCKTGTDGAIAAQALADMIGKPVLAPSDSLFIFPDDKMVIAKSIQDAVSGTDLGEWRLFSPRKEND